MSLTTEEAKGPKGALDTHRPSSWGGGPCDVAPTKERATWGFALVTRVHHESPVGCTCHGLMESSTALMEPWAFPKEGTMTPRSEHTWPHLEHSAPALIWMPWKGEFNMTLTLGNRVCSLILVFIALNFFPYCFSPLPEGGSLQLAG